MVYTHSIATSIFSSQSWRKNNCGGQMHHVKMPPSFLSVTFCAQARWHRDVLSAHKPMMIWKWFQTYQAAWQRRTPRIRRATWSWNPGAIKLCASGMAKHVAALLYQHEWIVKAHARSLISRRFDLQMRPDLLAGFNPGTLMMELWTRRPPSTFQRAAFRSYCCKYCCGRQENTQSKASTGSALHLDLLVTLERVHRGPPATELQQPSQEQVGTTTVQEGPSKMPDLWSGFHGHHQIVIHLMPGPLPQRRQYQPGLLRPHQILAYHLCRQSGGNTQHGYPICTCLWKFW